MSVVKRTVLSLIGNQLLHTARIAEVHEASKNFRFIDIEAKAFQKSVLRPGEKVQINTGNWDLRTYTPISLDPETGRLGILAYLNGKGPGSRWASRAQEGDTVQILGPRPSLRVPATDDEIIFFGDETTVAVAASLRRQPKRPAAMQMIFEATAPVEINSVTQDLGLSGAKIFSKSADGEVSEEILRTVTELAKGDCQVVLTGRAQSIQQMRDRLKQAGFPLAKVITQAYWSEGRTGLD